MKATRFLGMIAAAAVATVGLNAYAFHSGGVAECEGCHSMHSPKSSSHLLVGSDASSSCLSCHEPAVKDASPSSYHISTVGTMAAPGDLPVERTPGGDFAWLKKTYTWLENGSPATEFGSSHGHNIIAADQGYEADAEIGNVAPGGTFPTSQLGCESCHDPHGKARRLSDGTYAATGSAPIIGSGSYNNSATPAAGQAVGVYRILWGAASPNQPSGATYTSYPVAIAPSTYNRTEAATQTRVAYGGGGSANSWGNWCGTCHGAFNGTGSDKHHPVEAALGNTIANNYAKYVKSGDMSGSAATSYTSLVPFAEATQNIATLKSHTQINDSYLGGPSSSDTVTCLSCHRAHASGFEDALRFYYSWEFTTSGGLYPGLDNPNMTGSRVPIQARGRNQADFAAAYYDRSPTIFAVNQRSLCNKCHAQD